MSFSTTYRPPPPAPSAYFAMQHASNSAANAIPSPVSTPGTYLPRIPSKLSLHVSQGQTIPIHGSQVATQTAPASRSNSASSITALPSLSSSLNNLHAATSIEHLEVVGTRTAEADELLRRVIQGNVKRLSNPSIAPPPSHVADRTFARYSDDSDSDEDQDEDDDEAYYRQPVMKKIDQSRHLSLSSPAISSQTRPNHQSGSGRSGLVMNRSRRDRLASGGSSSAFAL